MNRCEYCGSAAKPDGSCRCRSCGAPILDLETTGLVSKPVPPKPRVLQELWLPKPQKPDVLLR